MSPEILFWFVFAINLTGNIRQAFFGWPVKNLYLLNGVCCVLFAGLAFLREEYVWVWAYAAFGALSFWWWWRNGGGGDTKRAARAAWKPFAPTRRTAPQKAE